MLAGALVVVALVLGGLYAGQRALIYFPDVMTEDELSRRVAAGFGPHATLLPGFDAIVVEPPQASATAIVFHGNAGSNADRGYYANELAARGLRVVLAGYPGYAARPGTPSERSIVADAIALYEHVAHRYPEDRLVLVGESLGTGVAAAVATAPSLPRAADRLVLITPLASIPDAAARLYPFLPVRALARDRFDVLHALPGYRGHVTILLAGKDEILGPEAGVEVAAVARARGPTEVVELPRAGHNDWLAYATAETWDRIAGVTTRPD
jgi:pimeloyl-ACP methyl ester carboxylesterase